MTLKHRKVERLIVVSNQSQIAGAPCQAGKQRERWFCPVDSVFEWAVWSRRRAETAGLDKSVVWQLHQVAAGLLRGGRCRWCGCNNGSQAAAAAAAAWDGVAVTVRRRPGRASRPWPTKRDRLSWSSTAHHHKHRACARRRYLPLRLIALRSHHCVFRSVMKIFVSP